MSENWESTRVQNVERKEIPGGGYGLGPYTFRCTVCKTEYKSDFYAAQRCAVDCAILELRKTCKHEKRERFLYDDSQIDIQDADNYWIVEECADCGLETDKSRNFTRAEVKALLVREWLHHK